MAAAKKAPAKASTAAQGGWKADYGEGAKPAGIATTVATSIAEVKEGVKVSYKPEGKKLHEVAAGLAKKHSLVGENDQKVVTALLRAAMGDGCRPVADIVPHKKFNAVAQDVVKAAGVNSKFRGLAERKTEEYAAQLEESKKAALVAGANAQLAIKPKLAKIEKQTTDLINEKIKSISGVTALENGRFQLTEDISEESIAEGFSAISGMVAMSSSLEQGFAMAEARFAQAIEAIGKQWIIYFNPKDNDQAKCITRIKQAIGALNKMDRYKVEMPKASLTTIRVVMEANYNKTDEKDNAERLQKVVKICNEYYDENGKYPPQGELRNIVSEHKVQGGSKRHNWVYIITVVEGEILVVGTLEKDNSLAQIAAITVHIGSMSYLMHSEHGVLLDPVKIGNPSKELLELAKSSAPAASESVADDEVEVEEAEWPEEEEESEDEAEEEGWEEEEDGVEVEQESEDIEDSGEEEGWDEEGGEEDEEDWG